MDATWSSDGTRAALPMVSLAVMAQGPVHGYALLGALSDLGFASLKGSTLYPLLSRHEEAGRVVHEWHHEQNGPAKKVYALTQKGQEDLATMQEEWRALDAAVRHALGAQVLPSTTHHDS